MGFLRYALIFLLIYFGVRIFMRYVVPLLLGIFVRKAQKNFQNQFEQYQQQADPKQTQFQEGEVTISKKSNTKKSKGDDDGDYIDFEELKD